MSNFAARARRGQDRTSLYEDITNTIIAELEAGRLPWVQPWGSSGASAPEAEVKRECSSRSGYKVSSPLEVDQGAGFTCRT